MKKITTRGFRVPGFKASGISCGIKTHGDKDLALIYADSPSTTAGVFTKNKVVSPTITLSRKALKGSKTFRAVLINSGNANACTGLRGMEDCDALIFRLAEELSISPQEILIASTGIIGVPLPRKKILEALPDAPR